MSMLDLKELVGRYTKGDIGYSAFRREFVMRFAAMYSDDPALDTAVVEIESLCSDAAEGLVSSEAELKQLFLAALPAGELTGSKFRLGTMVFFGNPTVRFIPSGTGTGTSVLPPATVVPVSFETKPALGFA